PKIEIKKGEAVEISTGAAMPKGANAVVMLEYTRRFDENLEVLKAVTPGENVVFAGSDLMAGELLVREGTLITHREIGLLASCGIKTVKVYRRPRVAIISTGNELLPLGEELEHGKIYDVNSTVLAAAVEENGGEAFILGIARDCEEEIFSKIKDGLEKCEIVLTSGSTSIGSGDLIYKVFERVGKLLVHGIAVKPGKPTAIAFSNGKPIFGLPGYPTSCITVFEVLVAPLIRKLSGLRENRRTIKAKTAFKIFSEKGRREFLPVHLVSSLDHFYAYPVLGHYSGAVSAFAFSDGFLEIDEDTISIDEGEEVEVKLYSSLNPVDLVIIGSNCIGLEVLLSIMRKNRGFLAKVVNVGSTAGILAAKKGEADIAGAHLLDENGEYNVGIAKKYGFKGYLVKGYIREQGIVVAKGNPKRISSFKDLLREEVVFINRNKGSGTRSLIDMNFSKVAEKLGLSFEEVVSKVKGYEVEARTHTSVAVAVATGKADAGVALKSAAIKYNLDFIPLRSEEYDFLIPKNKMEKEIVKFFIETLRSDEFARELEKIEGLKTYKRTGEVLEI
ncbi:MAG: molybdopterin biosynthesis protein, partial [Archaeoglobaceae archaeon]|nr:molybdopterin biosynthesis protein [Archaeoglobaceae archaeon]MCX8151877.1 molybdopterin biosynthesis protein [Archaeoglobaceae archaeon]MDW8013266.1 molybdopterin biosynthesis protein [Archaeoglobaceae archaeon]